MPEEEFIVCPHCPDIKIAYDDRTKKFGRKWFPNYFFNKRKKFNDTAESVVVYCPQCGQRIIIDNSE